MYILETPSTELTSTDIDNAISDLKLNNIDIMNIDSLNYLFLQGDTSVVSQIKTYIQDEQLKLQNQPTKK